MTAQAYFLPRSTDEAVALLAEHGTRLLVIAGGTIAMPLINEGISKPDMVLGLRQAGINGMRRENGSLVIGAATTLSQALNQDDIPMLKQAAHAVGGWAIRNMGTVGGNLFAPPPAGDFATALLALDGQLKLVSQAGQRWLAMEDFYTGFMTNVLLPGELVTEIKVPVPSGKTAYLKFGRRQANTPAVVTVAVHVLLEAGIVRQARLAINAVGDHPLRAREAEAALIGKSLDEVAIAKAAILAQQECQPFDDPIASATYRRRMVGVYVRRALAEINS